MDQFYMIVLGAIGVLLILMLTAVGLLMYSAKSKPDPPIRSPCPDYWTFDGSGCKVGTVNIGELSGERRDNEFSGAPVGISDEKIYYTDNNDYVNVYINPNSTQWARKYSGLTEVCAKGKWATDLGIVWDGYTNTTEC